MDEEDVDRIPGRVPDNVLTRGSLLDPTPVKEKDRKRSIGGVPVVENRDRWNIGIALRTTLLINLNILSIGSLLVFFVFFEANYPLRYLFMNWKDKPEFWFYLEMWNGAVAGIISIMIAPIISIIIYHKEREVHLLFFKMLSLTIIFCSAYYTAMGFLRRYRVSGFKRGEPMDEFDDVPSFIFFLFIVIWLDISISKIAKESRLLKTNSLPIIFTTVWAVIYMYILPEWYLQQGDFDRTLIRLLIHPLISEVGLFIARYQTIKLDYFVESKYSWLPLFPQLALSGLYGRFLISNMRSRTWTVIASVCLGVTEILLRISVPFRDYWIIRLTKGKEIADTSVNSERSRLLRARVVLGEQQIETTCILISVGMIHAFRFSFEDEYEHIISDLLFSLAVQWGIEILADFLCMYIDTRNGITIMTAGKTIHPIGNFLVHLILTFCFTFYFVVMFFRSFDRHVHSVWKKNPP